MSERLETAARELESVFPGLEEIVRVDVDDSGVLVLTATGSAGTRWFTHDDRGLIECFPERDGKLPMAESLADTQGWRVLSYRPGRRMVVLVSRGGIVNVFKGHRKGRSARAAVNQTLAEGAMRAGAFRVPRLLRHDGANEALVFEFLECSEVELGPESVPVYERLGRELATFQGHDGSRDLKPFGVRDELGVLELWRAKISRSSEELPPRWEQVHARLVACSAHLPEPRFGMTHRDLHDRQVHRAGDDVTLLDFDLLSRADVALDPANLVAHLEWRGQQRIHGADPESARDLSSAFLAGLGLESEPGFDERFAFYRASALLRLALVYRLRPRWSASVAALVSRASEVLDDSFPTP